MTYADQAGRESQTYQFDPCLLCDVFHGSSGLCGLTNQYVDCVWVTRMDSLK